MHKQAPAALQAYPQRNGPFGHQSQRGRNNPLLYSFKLGRATWRARPWKQTQKRCVAAAPFHI